MLLSSLLPYEVDLQHLLFLNTYVWLLLLLSSSWLKIDEKNPQTSEIWSGEGPYQGISLSGTSEKKPCISKALGEENRSPFSASGRDKIVIYGK